MPFPKDAPKRGQTQAVQTPSTDPRAEVAAPVSLSSQPRPRAPGRNSVAALNLERYDAKNRGVMIRAPGQVNHKVMSPEDAVQRAIVRAERILPGTPAPKGKRDPRWQAIIRIGEFIETQPEPVWEFAHRWGKHAQSDLRMAVATCLLEHLLEHHFELLFPRVRRAAMKSPRFADAFCSCWRFGQAKSTTNAARMKRFENQLRGSRVAKRRAR